MIFAPVMRHATPHASQRAVDQSFERFFQNAVLSTPALTGTKGYTVEQDDTSYTLQIDIPGVSRAQISIGIEAAVVRIDSLADAPRKVQAAFELPQEIDAAASSAKLENGVLTLKLAKQVPVSKVVPLTVN